MRAKFETCIDGGFSAGRPLVSATTQGENFPWDFVHPKGSCLVLVIQ
jgi:hypothetical protein